MRLHISRRTFSQLLLCAGVDSALDLPSFAEQTAPHSGFAHPGMLHTVSDLERMRVAVEAKQGPIFDGFEKLQAHSSSQKTYASKGAFAEISRNPTIHAEEFNKDCNAAYQCAVMWKVTVARASSTSPAASSTTGRRP